MSEEEVRRPARLFSAAAEEALDACVHCGFCLPACPTYRVLGNEADSPRGRLVLLAAIREGRLSPADQDARRHLSLCLDCRACETVCPSGVRYSAVLEDARSAQPEELPRLLSLGLRHIVARGRTEALRRPLRLIRRSRFLARLAARGVGPARLLLHGVTAVPARSARATLPVRAEAKAPRRDEATLLLGCVMDLLFPHVTWAAAELLRESGYAVRVPPGQGCCGALHLHSGHRREAKALARALVDELDGEGPVVVDAAGCGSAMKGYGDLLADDPSYREKAAAFARRVVDVTEILAEALPPPPRPLPLRVVYDDPCHLQHGQGVTEAPRRLLSRLGVTLVDAPETSFCCGSAGVYNITHPEVAERLLARKLDALKDLPADYIVTANPGCQVQLRAGAARRHPVRPVLHVVELAALAFQLAPPEGMEDAWPRI